MNQQNGVFRDSGSLVKCGASSDRARGPAQLHKKIQERPIFAPGGKSFEAQSFEKQCLRQLRENQTLAFFVLLIKYLFIGIVLPIHFGMYVVPRWIFFKLMPSLFSKIPNLLKLPQHMRQRISGVIQQSKKKWLKKLKKVCDSFANILARITERCKAAQDSVKNAIKKIFIYFWQPFLNAVLKVRGYLSKLIEALKGIVLTVHKYLKGIIENPKAWLDTKIRQLIDCAKQSLEKIFKKVGKQFEKISVSHQKIEFPFFKRMRSIINALQSRISRLILSIKQVPLGVVALKKHYEYLREKLISWIKKGIARTYLLLSIFQKAYLAIFRKVDVFVKNCERAFGMIYSPIQMASECIHHFCLLVAKSISRFSRAFVSSIFGSDSMLVKLFRNIFLIYNAISIGFRTMVGHLRRPAIKFSYFSVFNIQALTELMLHAFNVMQLWAGRCLHSIVAMTVWTKVLFYYGLELAWQTIGHRDRE